MPFTDTPTTESLHEDAAQATMRSDLQTYLQAQWNDPDVSVSRLTSFGDGHSGFTYRTEVSATVFEGSAVLRTSPPGARATANADIERQARIMLAVARAGVPVPRVLATSSTARLAGRSFALTELVTGSTWEVALQTHTDLEVAGGAVHVLKCLRGVAVSDSGIANETPMSPLGEVARWGKLLERAPDWLRDAGDRLASHLARSAQPVSSPGLVHGDFHYGNMFFNDGRVSAVFDWEIAQIGDPAMDVGALAVASIRRKFALQPNGMGSVAVSVEELAELYGRPESDLNWFIAASCFKYGAIFGYNLMLHRRGKRIDPHYELLLPTMTGLMQEGMERLGGSVA